MKLDQILTNIAEFSSRLKYRDLPPGVVTASKERLLDTLACALGAYDCDTAKIGRSLLTLPSRPQLAGRIVGLKTLAAADDAAFVNACMIRNLELNDTFSPGGHPSDALGALFAVAPQIGASGESLITAAVVAYEIFIRLQLATKLRQKGWDQGFGISVGAAAGLANLMGLTPEVAQHAIAITAVANTPMRATRSGQLSLWKGAATAYAARNAVFGIQLANAGMTGPEAPFSGRHGLMDLITGPIELAPFGANADDYYMLRTAMKYWPVANSLQAVVWAGIELRKQVSADQLASLEVSTSSHSWSESGSEPAKWDPQTRATADHSIPYVLVRSLLYGVIDQQSYLPQAYLDPAIRPLMKRITVRADEDIDEGCRRRTVRLHVSAKDHAGKPYEVDIINALGHEKNPLSAKELADKFARLAGHKLHQSQITAALERWLNIEQAADTKQAFDLVEFDGGHTTNAH